MVQLVLTYIVVAAAFSSIAWKVYKELANKNKSGGCSSGCGGCGTAIKKKH